VKNFESILATEAVTEVSEDRLRKWLTALAM